MDAGNLLMKLSDNLSVRRAFGTAYEKDDMLIIPVALVAGGGGGGTGHPRHRDPAAGPDSLPEAGPAGLDATPQDSGPVDAGGVSKTLVLAAFTPLRTFHAELGFREQTSPKKKRAHDQPAGFASQSERCSADCPAVSQSGSQDSLL